MTYMKVEIVHIWLKIGLAVLKRNFYNFLGSSCFLSSHFSANGDLQKLVRICKYLCDSDMSRDPAMSYCVWVYAVANSRWLFWLGCPACRVSHDLQNIFQ